MAHSSLAVANYFLKHAEAQGVRMSPMKLQKLVYYANGWHLALKDEPLIDEQVEAWAYGPVIRSLYREFRSYGNHDITSKGSYYRSVRSPDGRLSSELITPVLSKENPDGKFATALLDRIWDIYGKYTAVQLSNRTHEEGTPWKQVFDHYKGVLPKGTDIPTDLMKSYFRNLSERSRV